MGLALAQAALHRGADVTLVHAPASWDAPQGCNPFQLSVLSKCEAMLECFPADLIVMSAAVAVSSQLITVQKLPKLPTSLP